MLSWIREKFGTAVIGSIIAFIAFVFVFYGVFSPKSTRGLHEGAVAGTVNGDSISISEFNRALSQKLEFFKNLTGGKMTEDQLKQYGIRDIVFQEVANRKILLQESKKLGIIASDEEVKERVQEIPAFQKEGKFNLLTYKKVLESNNHSAGSFERLVRDDISVQRWQNYFRDRIRFSEDEVQREFLLNHNRRNIKYVLLTAESAKKSVSVDQAEIKKFLADPTKLNLAQLKYNEDKNTAYSGQSFDQAKESIAKNILAGEKLSEIKKINENLANQILPLLSVEKAADSKVNALLKANQIEVKTTGLVTREQNTIPGIGDAKELIQEAFAANSPIDLKASGKAKKYQLGERILVAAVIDSEHPDLGKLPEQRATLVRQILERKFKGQQQEWMKKLIAASKIEKNSAVLSPGVE